jgi:ketosteroid isomerase-like protein
MAEHPNAAVIRDGFDMFNRADVEGLSNLIASDAVQRMPGDNAVSGEHKGRDNILAMYGKLGELTGGTFRAVIDQIYANDDRVVAIYRGTAERGPKKLDTLRALVFEMQNGKIAGLDDMSSDTAIDDDFFA